LVNEPLALGPGQQRRRPLPIVHAARVGAKVEPSKVAVQVGFADVVERAADAPLQQCEMRLDRVRVLETAGLSRILQPSD